ncbi:MAG: S46 family peptidase [Bacteroidetes bacterium]|nr:S46 family peptidase [Bacteroidota bacterium]
MKKSLLFVLSMSLLISVFASPGPDEGMWIPLLLNKNIEKMKEMGLKLSAEDIYHINNSSLKDAIVIFGGGCTGEMISPEGLLLTNHHCGFGRIQSHSTTEHNYLKDGFWARTRDDELANPGLSVKFLVRMEDVTGSVLENVHPGMTDSARNANISAATAAIVNEAEDASYIKASVESFFAGNEYYLVVYEVYTDVRLVGAPPSSIGKFGADTDNWMWPRHTGDFSLFRVYAGPDGKPAKYAKENIPMAPKHYLPISIKGVDKGDFAMIMGNPGRTERYLTSFGIQTALELKNPTIVKIRTKKLDIMREEMDASDAVRIQYASKYARTANYWKYFQGQSKGLKRLHVYDKKVLIEKDFQDWVQKNDESIRIYGNVISDIKEAYDVLDPYEIPKQYFFEAIFRGPDIIGMANRFRTLHRVLSESEIETEKVNQTAKAISGSLPDYFKDYYLPIDKKLFASMLEMYHADVGREFQPEYFLKLLTKFKGNYNRLTDYVFAKSILSSQSKMELFLVSPSKKVLDKDPVFQLMLAFLDRYLELGRSAEEAIIKKMNAERLFIAGLREMNPDKNYYPDANFTLRLTYGTVQDYYPADAVHFNYYTTMEGIMQKEDDDNWEFEVDEKLKELYELKDFGRYGQVDSKGNKTMRVCFLTNHDITGGNSGSPVLDANGHLVGLAFDGNWEAMSGDIAFEPELQRTINVDIRYVLFVIEKYAEAYNLIDEMTVVEDSAEELAPVEMLHD